MSKRPVHNHHQTKRTTSNGLKSTDCAKQAVCAICRKETRLKRCGNCREVYYCSAEHQKQDWNRHRNSCKQFQTGLMIDNFAWQPVVLPRMTNRLEDINVQQFADLIQTTPEDIEFQPSQIFDKEDQAVMARSSRARKDGNELTAPLILFFLVPMKKFRTRHILATKPARELAPLSPTTYTDEYKSACNQELKRLEEIGRSLWFPWTVRALWLPMNGTVPVLVNAKILKDADGSPDTVRWIGRREKTIAHVQSVTGTEVRGPLPHNLRIFHLYGADHIHLQAYANKVIVSNGIPWEVCPAGSILVMKVLDPAENRYMDIRLSDVQDVYDWFKEEGAYTVDTI